METAQNSEQIFLWEKIFRTKIIKAVKQVNDFFFLSIRLTTLQFYIESYCILTAWMDFFALFMLLTLTIQNVQFQFVL